MRSMGKRAMTSSELWMVIMKSLADPETMTYRFISVHLVKALETTISTEEREMTLLLEEAAMTILLEVLAMTCSMAKMETMS